MSWTVDYHLIMAAAGIVALAIIAFAVLRGWNGWLELRRAELGSRGRSEDGRGTTTTRIEVADLKERIRKLEVIAAMVDP